MVVCYSIKGQILKTSALSWRESNNANNRVLKLSLIRPQIKRTEWKKLQQDQIGFKLCKTAASPIQSSAQMCLKGLGLGPQI
jgi:hypothetical protein